MHENKNKGDFEDVSSKSRILYDFQPEFSYKRVDKEIIFDNCSTSHG